MTRRKETCFIQICHQYLCSKILSSLGSRDDPGMAQWWEHSPPTNVARVWFPASYVGGVCCWFSPCSDILNILNSNSIWIEDLHENQLQLMWLSSVYTVLYLFTINPWQSNDSPQRFFLHCTNVQATASPAIQATASPTIQSSGSRGYLFRQHYLPQLLCDEVTKKGMEQVSPCLYCILSTGAGGG